MRSLRAEEDELPRGGAAIGIAQVEHLHAVGDGGRDNDGRAQVAGEVAGLGVDGRAARRPARASRGGTATLILLQQTGEALDFALVGRGDQDARVLLA